MFDVISLSTESATSSDEDMMDSDLEDGAGSSGENSGSDPPSGGDDDDDALQANENDNSDGGWITASDVEEDADD